MAVLDLICHTSNTLMPEKIRHVKNYYSVKHFLSIFYQKNGCFAYKVLYEKIFYNTAQK